MRNGNQNEIATDGTTPDRTPEHLDRNKGDMRQQPTWKALHIIVRWMRQHPLKLLFLLPVLGITAFVLIFSWITTPTTNPAPKEAITFHGKFFYDKGYEIVFTQTGYTTTPWLNRICGVFFVGHPVPCGGGTRGEIFVPRRIADSRYEITLYRDYYNSGIAGWGPPIFAYHVVPVGTRTWEGIWSQEAWQGGVHPTQTELACRKLEKRIANVEIRDTDLFCMERNEIHRPYPYLPAPTEPNYVEDRTVRRREINFRMNSEISDLQIKEK